MNKFDLIGDLNVNMQPIPTSYVGGFSFYESLSNLLGTINSLIVNNNLGADEISELQQKKQNIEDYLKDMSEKRKLDQNGNFTGTWNGCEMHTSTEGLASDWNSAKGMFGSVANRLDTNDNKVSKMSFHKLISSIYNTISDNSTDNYTQLNAMFKDAFSNIVYDPSVSSNSLVTTSIEIPNGVYRIKQAELLLNTISTRAENLVINGNGATFIFDGFEGNCLSFNDTLLNVDIHNLNFISKSDSQSSNRILINSTSNGGTQSIRFHQCSFGGTLKYGINLLGGNNNSEWAFNQCGFIGQWDSFLYIGKTNTSDQFLNYWFNNCRYWCSSNWITAYKGGHFVINHCDISGYAPTTETYLYNLLDGAHSMGVTSFIDDGSRYELKSENAKVIKCEWDNARISFENCDLGSNSYITLKRNDYFHFSNLTSGNGSSYTFNNCVLLGTFKLQSSMDSKYNNLVLNECWLLGDNTTTKISDIFEYVKSSNVGEFIKVNLIKSKYNGIMYNTILDYINSSISQIGQKITLSQSPYLTLTSDWIYHIYQDTIIDDVTIMTTFRQDGSEYKFAIKSDIGVVSAYSGSTLTMNTNWNYLYVGNKITIGSSNTIYTITSMDLSGTNKYIALDKPIENSVVFGDTVSFILCDMDIVNMVSLKLSNPSGKYIVKNNLYLKSYGATFPSSGIGAKIIVKTIE